MGKDEYAKPNMAYVSDEEALSIKTLEIFLSDAKQAIEKKGAFNVAISGGHTPAGFFERLGESRQAQCLDWDKVQLFWVDERCVPPRAEASNFHLANRTFLHKILIPSANVHRVHGEYADYTKAMRYYEDSIRHVFKLEGKQVPRFDLIILGMGSDGHIASLFRNSYAIFDTKDLVGVVYFPDGGYDRITLMPSVLSAANHLLILVSGQKKADILKEVMQNEPDEVKYPVHALWPILEKITWIVDNEATGTLSE